MNATYNNLSRTNNNFAGGNNSILKSPISNFGAGFPKSPITGFGAQLTQYDFGHNSTVQAAVNINEDNLRPLAGTDSDPIALFLSTVNKLHFLTQQLKPSLNKDHRLIQIEAFFKVIFAKSHKDTQGTNG